MDLLEELKMVKSQLEKEIDIILIDYKNELFELSPNNFSNENKMEDYIMDKHNLGIARIKNAIHAKAEKYNTVKTEIDVFSLVVLHLEKELTEKYTGLSKIDEDYRGGFSNTQPL